MKDYFGDIASLREKVKEKPVLTIALGYKEHKRELEELCGQKINIVHTPELTARILKVLML